MSTPLRVAVVGHVNTGKTSLISTLARRSDLLVGDGRTTLGVQEVEFRSQGETLLVLLDTPGFEMVAEIGDELDRLAAAARATGRRRDDESLVNELVATPAIAARQDLELDLRALGAVLAADVVIYVVDATQEPLERLRDEVYLLVRTGRPVVGVLNFTAEVKAHTAAWHDVFRREKVHAIVAFDVMIKDDQAEGELFRALATVVAHDRREALSRLARAHDGDDQRHRRMATRAAAETLLDIMTLQVEVARDATADAEGEARARLEREAVGRERRGLAAIAKAHGFREDEVSDDSRAQAEIFTESLFDPRTIRRYAPDWVSLAAGGAAAGGALDLVVGGASLFLGAVIGSVIGLASGVLRRAIRIQERNAVAVARLHPDLAWVVLGRLLVCHDAFRARTHARRDVVVVEDSSAHKALKSRPGSTEVVRLLHQAQGDPSLTGQRSPRRTAEFLAELERALDQVMA